MYECFHCGARAVVWSADFMFEEFGRPGNGLVHVCHCQNCGADIEYYISDEGPQADQTERSK